MSVAIDNAAAGGEQSYQPFQCLVCQSRFTRHENLKRHAALHARSQDKTSFACDYCPTTFSRRDLRNRHVKRKHPRVIEHEERRRVRDTTRWRWSELEEVRERPDAHSTGGYIPTISPEGHFGTLSQSWGEVSEVSVLADMHTACEQLKSGPKQDYYVDRPGPQSIPSSSASTSTSMPVPIREISGSSYIGSIPGVTETDLDVSLWLGDALPSLDPSPHHLQQVGADTRLETLPPSSSSPISVIENAETPVANLSQSLPEGLSPRDLPYVQEEWAPSASQLRRGQELYFAHVSHFVPFLHSPTFDATQAADYLVLAMLCLAFQHGEDPDSDDQAGSGETLSAHCFHRARVRIASCEEQEDDLAHSVALVQTYLLLEIGAIFYLCGKRDSSLGLKMHSKMISLARFGGLTQSTPPSTAGSKDLESLWGEFIRTESHKRTLLAAHQIDALWYQFLSIPRCLSHLEIKHELPCPEACWAASSAAEWAHRQLVMRQGGTPSVQYVDAVRQFLSPDPDVDSLPTFDPYGAINITQFLLSSAREVSGWSAMTGRLSLERLEPLKASLVALGPAVRPQQADAGTAGSSSPSSSCVAEATWEMAMIEMQIWSPSHTCGIVEGSVVAVLKQSTYLASSCEVLFGAETAQLAQPHIDWFLRYLDTTIVPDSEPPWVGFYAYKAFLISWQLVRKGVVGAMQVVGVHDGDVEGALMWARKVFRRREKRQLGKLMMTCLEELAEQYFNAF